MDQPKTCITLLSPIYDNIGQLFDVVATHASVSMTNIAGSKHGIILSSNHTKLNAWSKETNTHVKENEYTSRVGNSAKKILPPMSRRALKERLGSQMLIF